MKIGKHLGFRASINGKYGYVFPTIVSDRYKSVLFIFDDEYEGHDAPSYFLRHPEDWKLEYSFRCFWYSENSVTIEQEQQKKVII